MTCVSINSFVLLNQLTSMFTFQATVHELCILIHKKHHGMSCLLMSPGALFHMVHFVCRSSAACSPPGLSLRHGCPTESRCLLGNATPGVPVDTARNRWVCAVCWRSAFRGTWAEKQDVTAHLVLSVFSLHSHQLENCLLRGNEISVYAVQPSPSNAFVLVNFEQQGTCILFCWFWWNEFNIKIFISSRTFLIFLFSLISFILSAIFSDIPLKNKCSKIPHYHTFFKAFFQILTTHLRFRIDTLSNFKMLHNLSSFKVCFLILIPLKLFKMFNLPWSLVLALL